MASGIWGRELEPLGVRTLTLVTTSVKTPAFDNIPKPKIPEKSYYYVIRDYLDRLTDGRLQEGAPSTRTYGLKVVAEIAKGTTGEIWVGKDAGINRWASKWLPQSLFVSAFSSNDCIGYPGLPLLLMWSTNHNKLRTWLWTAFSSHQESWARLLNCTRLKSLNVALSRPDGPLSA